MTRARFLAAALLCVACATPDAIRRSAEADFAISLSRDVSENRPVLVVTITNRSQSQLCIQKETLQNPRTHQMELHLYDARGRAVRPSGGGGFLPPPLEGNVRLEPGEVARAEYFLDRRFRLPGGGTPFPSGMRAHVSFPYGRDCSEVWALRATSARQPI